MQNTLLVEEGEQYLDQTIENRPDFDEAMTYLERILRRKADLDNLIGAATNH